MQDLHGDRYDDGPSAWSIIACGAVTLALMCAAIAFWAAVHARGVAIQDIAAGADQIHQLMDRKETP